MKPAAIAHCTTLQLVVKDDVSKGKARTVVAIASLAGRLRLPNVEATSSLPLMSSARRYDCCFTTAALQHVQAHIAPTHIVTPSQRYCNLKQGAHSSRQSNPPPTSAPCQSKPKLSRHRQATRIRPRRTAASSITRPASIRVTTTCVCTAAKLCRLPCGGSEQLWVLMPPTLLLEKSEWVSTTVGMYVMPVLTRSKEWWRH